MGPAQWYLLIIFFVFTCFGSAWADQVIWIEAEDFSLDKSTLVSEDVEGLVWVINDLGALGAQDDEETGVFGDKFMRADGAVPLDWPGGSSGLVYVLPNILEGQEEARWYLWARWLTPNMSSLWYEARKDEEWVNPSKLILHGNAANWEWKKGNKPLEIEPGTGNLLRISERESNFSVDVLCLRNDGKTPTDKEYEKYLRDHPKFLVAPSGKLASMWSGIKYHK